MQLRPDLGISALTTWSGDVVDLLTGVLGERGLEVDVHFNHSEKGEDTDA